MADEPSGTRDDTDDGRADRSVTEPDAGSTSDANRRDSDGDDWDVADRTDGPEQADSFWDDREDDDRIPIDLSDSSDGADVDDEGDEYGPESNSTPVEPGDPDLENAVFVVLGAIAMVLVLVRLVMIPLG